MTRNGPTRDECVLNPGKPSSIVRLCYNVLLIFLLKIGQKYKSLNAVNCDWVNRMWIHHTRHWAFVLRLRTCLMTADWTTNTLHSNRLIHGQVENIRCCSCGRQTWPAQAREFATYCVDWIATGASMATLLFCTAAVTIFLYIYYHMMWMFGCMALGIASKF